jgi:hypothetical protein
MTNPIKSQIAANRERFDEMIEEISTEVTDYGYNDEYGYYSDWKDGVKPIIMKTKSHLVSFQTSLLQTAIAAVEEMIKEEKSAKPADEVERIDEQAYCAALSKVVDLLKGGIE